MVHFVRSLIGAAALLSVTSAAPMAKRDSASNGEIPVSAADGTPRSDAPAPTGASNDGTYNGGSSNGYGGSGYGGSGYGGSSNSWSSSSMMDESTSMMDESTSMMDMSSSMMEESTMMSESSMTESAYMSTETVATYSSSASYSMATYGSGSSSWGGSGYDSCVQQCAASYAPASMTWTPSPTQSSDSSGGSGSTHTIIVAPSQGVLRYVPFNVNASVGDTLLFKWGADKHFVRSSSGLEVCNQTGAFDSGVQNKGHEFTLPVNDTNPTWFYCATPGHCQKGMFGGVNIGPNGVSNPSDSSSYMSLGQAMEGMNMTGDMSAMWSYAKTKTAGNSFANNWGMNVNVHGMSNDAMMQVVENVAYNQMVIAGNPDSVKDGKFAIGSNNVSFPMDFAQALAAAPAPGSSDGSSTGAPATGAAASGSSVSAAPAATSASSNGAGSLASSSVVVGLVAVVATFFAL